MNCKLCGENSPLRFCEKKEAVICKTCCLFENDGHKCHWYVMCHGKGELI